MIDPELILLLHRAAIDCVTINFAARLTELDLWTKLKSIWPEATRTAEDVNRR